MRAQLGLGVAAAERALTAAGPSAAKAPAEPLITISTDDMHTGDPCCQVAAMNWLPGTSTAQFDHKFDDAAVSVPLTARTLL